jgi:hypothetical protein
MELPLMVLVAELLVCHADVIDVPGAKISFPVATPAAPSG